MDTKILTLAIPWLLIGCAGSDEGRPTRWESLPLTGSTLTLADEKKLEIFSFHGGGVLTASIGTKDGPVTSPVLYWAIQENTLVISESPQRVVVERLSMPSMKGYILTATRMSGDKAKYKVVRDR